MRKLKYTYKTILIIIYSFLLSSTLTKNTIAEEISIQILGNEFTDSQVILSLLENKPDKLNNEYSNYILKTLDNSLLFKNVKVEISENKYVIFISEYSNINNIYYRNNKRIKDDELDQIVQSLRLVNLNPNTFNLFINEVKKIYASYGYNSAEIIITEDVIEETNTADLTVNFEEGKITKINQIYFNGNNKYSSQELLTIINSKYKTLRNIFANNNFKVFQIERDKILLSNYYKDNGYIDISIAHKIEFLSSNRVNIYFNINEGEQYIFSNINLNDTENILDKETTSLVQDEINLFSNKNKSFSLNKINELKNNISKIIISNGLKFFEIKLLEKKVNNEINILFDIYNIKPKYTNQIIVKGNTRTYDYVIRRELEISEGDAIYDTQISSIYDKLNSLNLFKSIDIKEVNVEDNLVNLEINVEEKQTGSVNAGVSVGTLDGFAILAGLKERNFYGTGRSLEILVNTSEDKNEFIFNTTDRLSYENDVDVNFKTNYKQEDFSKSSSYKLNTLITGVGLQYKINKRLYHKVDFSYLLKDYEVTDTSSVSDSIGKSSGENISFLLNNNLVYSTLNKGFISKNGNYLNFNNSIETPTSSSNGYIRNIITFKKYYSYKKNIISAQTRVGNILSLNNNDILTDDKFALGGRWLRGFDNYGAGPRNSRTSYVGGNNLFVTKFDYSRELNRNSNFPLYLNLFNDYGIVWDNKTEPLKNDNNLRASFGLGLKYYSPIGPIGLTWGFPFMDEEYDIKRMFLFSIGNID